MDMDMSLNYVRQLWKPTYATPAAGGIIYSLNQGGFQNLEFKTNLQHPWTFIVVIWKYEQLMKS